MDDKAVKRCVVIYWAVIGCVCSFLCPLYLGQDDWAAIGDISRVQLVMMLVSCTAAAGAYLEGYARRPRGRSIPAPIELAGAFTISVLGRASCVMIVAGHPSPNTVGLVLLSVAAFVLLEMAKPDLRIYRIFSYYWAYLPVITGILHDGWDYPYLTQPAMLALPAIFQIVVFKMMDAMLEALVRYV